MMYVSGQAVMLIFARIEDRPCPKLNSKILTGTYFDTVLK